MSHQPTDGIEAQPTRRQVLKSAAAGAVAAVIPPLVESSVVAPDGNEAVPASAIYLSDLDRCQPATALSRKPKRGHWRLLDFEADNVKGVMLMAGQNTAAPEIRYRPEQKGWYAISIGLRSAYGDTQLQVRLSDDTAFNILHHRVDNAHRHRVDDMFWKFAELKGQEIVFRQVCAQTVPENAASVGNACEGAWIAWIRLVPLSEAERKAVQADRESRASCRLFAHNDAWSDLYRLRPTTAEEIRRMVEPYRDTDFSRLYWEGCQGDRCNYFTKIGLMPSDDLVEDPYRVGDRLAAESWRILREKKIDPFQVALEHAHSLGLEFHGAFRATGFHFPVPEDEWNIGGVYDQHPEWRGTDRMGRATPRLSYAFPQFRAFVVSLLREIAGYPVDGVCLLYNRRPPFLEFEPPVVDGFRSRFGRDPREVDDHDPQWLAWRATFLTEFMREVRTAMKEVAQQQQNRSRPLEISAVVMGTEAENRYYGLDLAAWVRDGLVDTLIPYTSAPRLNSALDSWLSPDDSRWFRQITEGTGCRLALNIMPRQLPAETCFARAHGIYESGVQHLFFWDCNDRHDYSVSWDALRRLGHREEIAAWVQSGSPPFPRSASELTKLGDWDLSYATPG